MKELNIIAAIGKNNELGKNNDLIWRVKEDIKFFRETTTNHYIVMGRNTFESLPKILSNRTHIVLTHSDGLPKEAIVCKSIEDFLSLKEKIDDDIYVIGGARIYSELIDYADKMYLTEFDSTCNDADVYFPTIDKEDWDINVIGTYEDNNPKYLRKEYIRKKWGKSTKR